MRELSPRFKPRFRSYGTEKEDNRPAVEHLFNRVTQANDTERHDPAARLAEAEPVTLTIFPTT